MIMLMAQWSAPFPWGLLVVSDTGADFSGLPDEVDRSAAFNTGGDAVVFYVDNDALSRVAVRVWHDHTDDSERSPIGSAPISVPSGRLIVGDVERSPAVTKTFDVQPGSYLIDAYFDVPVAAESVDLVLRDA